jgi:nucleosome assembly protein 1-like 1
VVPENPDDLSEEELEALQQQMDEDYEIATAFRESLVPRAVEWFTGEAAPPLYGDEFDDGEYGEYEDEEPEELQPRRR